MLKLLPRERIHFIKKRIGSGWSKFTSRIKTKRSTSKSVDRPLVDKKLKEKIFAALSYLYVLVLVAVIFGRKDKFIAFHAKQGLSLLVLWAAAFFLLWVPVLAWLAIILILIEIVVGLINVFRAQEKRLPLVGNLV